MIGGKKWGCVASASRCITGSLCSNVCVFVEGVHAFGEPADLSSVCCCLWQPAVRGAQGERGGQVKAGPAADEDWSQRSLTPNEW